MDKVYSRINWQNEPATTTPINEVNLNKIDAALNEIDNRVVNFSTTKANQSDLLASLRTVAYNATAGVFTFTYNNGGTFTVDLNVEKIPVTFSLSEQGILTMTTADGTQFTADIADLIKTYEFVDSSEINFTVTIDSHGDRTITASLVNGSITGAKLQPNYLADVTAQAQAAEASAESASSSEGDAAEHKEDSEAWAKGTINGTPIPSSHPAYNNDSKHWAEQAAAIVGIGIATTTTPGIVKPDGDTISVDSSGKISFAGITDAEYNAISALLN